MSRYRPMMPTRSEGCGRKAKRRGGTLHTAHDAPLEMPDRYRAEPLHLHAAGVQAGGREREMIDLLAVEGPKPKPANSYDTAIRRCRTRQRSSSCSNACGRLLRP